MSSRVFPEGSVYLISAIGGWMDGEGQWVRGQVYIWMDGFFNYIKD